MPFYDDMDVSHQRKTPSTNDIKRAKKLLEVIHRRKMPSSTVKSQAHEFRKLRELDKIPKDQITLALNWWIENRKDQYTPRVRDAKEFRTKFQRIIDAINRNGQQQVEISQEAKTIFSNVRGMGWPKGSIETLPTAIQLSLDRAREFRSNLLKYKNRLNKETTDRRAVENVLASFGNIVTFTENWFNSVHSRIANWSAWDGNVVKEAFDPNSRKFDSMGKQWVTEYRGESKFWNTIKEQVNNAN